MGGHSCASCETYIGDLNEKKDYVAWNKYPQRERDKNYRVGNGFSRMLNMLNLDIKNTFEGIKENNYDSESNFRYRKIYFIFRNISENCDNFWK